MLKEIKDKIQFAAIAAPIYAAESINLQPKAGAFDELTNLTPGRMVSGAISLVLLTVSLVFFFILIAGGLKWITSGGDEKKVAAARAGITNALIGLVIVFAAWAIIRIMESLFGITMLGQQGLEITPF
jgi:TRAP-type C4-dicarboxylate transport system permease small subunit